MADYDDLATQTRLIRSVATITARSPSDVRVSFLPASVQVTFEVNFGRNNATWAAGTLQSVKALFATAETTSQLLGLSVLEVPEVSLRYTVPSFVQPVSPPLLALPPSPPSLPAPLQPQSPAAAPGASQLSGTDKVDDDSNVMAVAVIVTMATACLLCFVALLTCLVLRETRHGGRKAPPPDDKSRHSGAAASNGACGDSYACRPYFNIFGSDVISINSSPALQTQRLAPGSAGVRHRPANHATPDKLPAASLAHGGECSTPDTRSTNACNATDVVTIAQASPRLHQTPSHARRSLDLATAEAAAAEAELALRKSTLEASLTSVALHQAQQAVQQAVLNAQQVVESPSARCGTGTSSMEQLESASRIDEALRLSQIALNRAEIALNHSSDSRAQIALSQIALSRAEQVMSLQASRESSGVDAAPLPLSPLETSRLAAVRQLAFSDDDSALATPRVELSTSNSAHNLERARNADKGGLHVAEMWI